MEPFAEFTPAATPAPAEAPVNAWQPPEPFAEPIDVDDIIKNLALDRQLKLEIPQELMHPDFVYRQVNAQPHNVMRWHQLGYRPVTNPEIVDRYRHLHGGVDERGAGYGIITMACHKKIAEIRRAQIRKRIVESREALDPRTRVIEGGGQYAEVAQDKGVTNLKFTPAGS